MRRKLFFAMILGLMLSAGVGYAEDFSADVVSISKDGTFTAKMYVSGEKSRMEIPGAITINRLDKKVTWLLMLNEKMYMEQPINMRSVVGTQEKMDGEVERVAEGQETVDGRNTTKYRVTSEVRGKREVVFQWIDEAARVPVKTVAVDGSWSSEFKNIETGALDPSLFEIPADYQNMSFGMSGMGDMLGAMGEKGVR